MDNRSAQILGYEKKEIVYQASDWYKLSHPDDGSLIKQRLADYLAGITYIFETEYRMKHASGEWIWVAGKGKITHRLPDGTPHLSGTLQDISR